jgi:hypothetical protein
MDTTDKSLLDAERGTRDIDRWAVLLAQAHADLKAAQQRIGQLEAEIAALKKQMGGSATLTKLDQPYSVDAEEKRQEARGRGRKRQESKKQRRGRIANEDKVKRAQRVEDVYPENIPHDQCRLSPVRLVWRFENGLAVLVAYRIYRGPKKQYGRIPGVLGRSEFGLEIVVTIAYLVYVSGLSFDKVCFLIGFFQNLNLSKSQADALLRQLSYHWREEFAILCTLLANSLVVHADETGWSIHSVWAFLSEKVRLLFFGVHKDGATLQAILDPETFKGLVFSDDAAVYANFSNAQKCWAHLLRKAIKLTLQDPTNESYRKFADELLDIFHEANRLRHDQRFTDAGRKRKVEDLVNQVFALCEPLTFAEPAAGTLPYDQRLLAFEIMRLALREHLFTFVLAKPAEQPNGQSVPLDGTNNEAERAQRPAAQARATGRTSKTLAGARRTSIVTSVLESLRLYLPKYTLSNVIEEIKRWIATGRSCFRELMEKLNIALADDSVLDRVLPEPSG